MSGIDRTEAVVLHQALFGRPPSARQMQLLAAGAYPSLAEWRATLIDSDAFEDMTGFRSNEYHGRFHAAGQPGAPRIGVLGNCQAPEIARRLALTTPCSVIASEVMGYSPDRYGSFMQDFRACDFIIQQDLHSDQFEGIRPHEMELIFPGRIFTFQPAYFAGLQPDIVALGLVNARVESPVAAHSRVGIAAYLAGMGVDDALATFTADNFARIGLFARWDESERELRKRDGRCTIQIADEVIALCRSMPAMLTENHPAQVVYDILIRKMTGMLELGYTPYNVDLYVTEHQRNPIWPVYDEVAEHHALPYRTSQLFQVRAGLMSRRELLTALFAIYDDIGIEALRHAAARHGLVPKPA